MEILIKVLPAGDVTISFNSPGCFLVSSTIFADPKTYNGKFSNTIRIQAA
jgi:hypothetical protein